MAKLERRLLGNCQGRQDFCRQSTTKTRSGLMAIERLAPHMFILERNETGPPIYSHVGCAIRHIIGSDPRGKVFYDYWDAEAREALESCFDLSAAGHLAFRLFSLGRWAQNVAMEFETTLVPVTMADAIKRRFVGLSLMTGDRPVKAKTNSQIQHLKNIAFLCGTRAGGSSFQHAARRQAYVNSERR
jgi:hypothetical protein